MAVKYSDTVVTPQYALELLSKNTANFRNLDNNRVGRYADALTSDSWKFNGDTICIGSDGVLIDGQHRLHAIVRSGIPMRCIIVSGLDPESASTKDRGKPRTVAQWVNHKGIRNAAVMAAMAKYCILYQDGQWGAIGMQTIMVLDNLIFDFIEKHHDAMQDACRLSSTSKGYITPSLTGAVMLIAAEFTPPSQNNVCQWFCDGLSTGAGLSSNDAVLHLRNRLSVSHSAKRESPFMQRMFLTLCWNKTAESVPMKRLSFTLTGPSATPPITEIKLAPKND